MLEPVELDDILISVIAGALVVMFGALYAMAFAIGRLSGSRFLSYLAFGFFAMLAVAVLVLANALHLTGYWQSITVMMLVGYLLAPYAIWKLCIGTHPERITVREVSVTGELH